MTAILTDDIFKCIFLNENDRISIWISLKFVRRSPIDNKPALVQVMTWHRTGDKPLPEPMLMMHIRGTRGDELTYPRQSTHLQPPVTHICVSELGQCSVRRQTITVINSDLLSIEPLGTNFSEIRIKTQRFHSWKCFWNVVCEIVVFVLL